MDEQAKSSVGKPLRLGILRMLEARAIRVAAQRMIRSDRIGVRILNRGFRGVARNGKYK
jgi:hypothetical protein